MNWIKQAQSYETSQHFEDPGNPPEYIEGPSDADSIFDQNTNASEEDIIKIKKSNVADTRTCDWTKVSEKQLLKNSKMHISDVKKGLKFLSELINEASKNHDWTKIKNSKEFHEDFATGFEKIDWWKMHQQKERHHFNDKKYIQKDVNLIDILEQIVDGVMAGMARSGKYRKEVPDKELLLKAYENTAKLLLENIEVEQSVK